MLFSYKKDLRYLELTIEYNLKENIKRTKVYTNFKMLKVKVLILFFRHIKIDAI
jgi:hypothetical protein